MNTIKGFFSALLLMILLLIVNTNYVKIGEFIIGWACCMVYLIVSKRMKND